MASIEKRGNSGRERDISSAGGKASSAYAVTRVGVAATTWRYQ